jgi:hypothetical protein
MGVSLRTPSKGSALFSINYGYSLRNDAIFTAAANALIAKISTACGVPELAQRARRTVTEHWNPYLFNV